MRWQKASKLWGRDQGQHESVDAYVTALQKIAKSAGVHDDMLRYAITHGLRKELRNVIQSGVTTLSGLIDAARIAELQPAMVRLRLRQTVRFLASYWTRCRRAAVQPNRTQPRFSVLPPAWPRLQSAL